MGAKGDRAVKEPQARRMYAEGKGIPEISQILDVSETSIRKWRAESLVPGEATDGWDAARAAHRSHLERLRKILDDQMVFVETTDAADRSAPMIDALAKIFSIVERAEAAQRSGNEVDRPKVFLESVQWMVRWLVDNDPAGLSVLERDFDRMVDAFKAESLAG